VKNARGGGFQFGEHILSCKYAARTMCPVGTNDFFGRRVVFGYIKKING
jgi:hypothetical protein